MSRVAVELSYFRRAQGNFTTTDNLDVAPDDFQPYCVTAPTDPRLPDGGGNQICGLYDIVPAKFGVATNNLVTFVDNLRQADRGVQRRRLRDERADPLATCSSPAASRPATPSSTAATRSWTTRGPSSASPRPPAAGTAATPGTGLIFNYCDFDTSWLTQVKATGSYTLPWQQIQIGGVLQNLPGQQVLAQWNITAGRRRRRHARPAAVGRREHLAHRAAGQAGDDVHAAAHAARSARVARHFSLGGARRLQVMADIFNAFNSNAAVGATSNAGEPPAAINTDLRRRQWLRPLNILQARYVKFGAQLMF